jgi:hypothetical protein
MRYGRQAVAKRLLVESAIQTVALASMAKIQAPAHGS